MNLKHFIERHPVLTYFILVYAIAWGGILLVVQTMLSSMLCWRERCGLASLS